MKAISILLYGILFSVITLAQSPDPAVLASAGGISSNGKMSLEWTLGETSISTISYGENLFTEGFHQPIILISPNKKPELVTATIKDLSITIAPNPVMSLLTVQFSGNRESVYTLSLFNASGKLLLSKAQLAKSNISTLAMDQMPAGIYFLRINNSKEIIKTFKVIKL